MPRLLLYMHECACLCVSMWRHIWGKAVCDGNLGRDVHEWPVFAHVSLSVLHFYICCLFITVLVVMLPGAQSEF